MSSSSETWESETEEVTKDGSSGSDFIGSDREENILIRNICEPDVNDYVLVKFSTKKTLLHYIGRVIGCNKENDLFTVDFLRKKGNTYIL